MKSSFAHRPVLVCCTNTRMGGERNGGGWWVRWRRSAPCARYRGHGPLLHPTTTVLARTEGVSRYLPRAVSTSLCIVKQYAATPGIESKQPKGCFDPAGFAASRRPLGDYSGAARPRPSGRPHFVRALAAHRFAMLASNRGFESNPYEPPNKKAGVKPAFLFGVP